MGVHFLLLFPSVVIRVVVDFDYAIENFHHFVPGPSVHQGWFENDSMFIQLVKEGLKCVNFLAAM